MKRVFVLLALALASFALIRTAWPAPAPLPDPAVVVLDGGLALVDGNATVAYAVLNLSRSAHVQGLALERPVPERVLLWGESDQVGFSVFSEALGDAFGNWHVPFGHVSSLDALSGPPAILILASSAISSDLLEGNRLASLLDAGWVVVHVGLPFSFVRKNDRVFENTRWPNQSAVLGFDFRTQDPLLGYSVSAGNASVHSRGRWQFAQKNGTLAFFDRTLDLGFGSPSDAAEAVADLVLNASWQAPLSRISANASGARTVFFDPSVATPASVLLLVRFSNASFRTHVFLPAPSARAIAPAQVWADRRATVSFYSNASEPEDVDAALQRDGQTIWRKPLGRIPAGVALRSLSFNTSLDGGDYLFSFSAPQKALAHARVRVVAPTVRIRFAELSSKAVYAEAFVGDAPHAFSYVEFNGTRLATDGQGGFRFKDASLSQGVRHYDFAILGSPVSVRHEVPSGFLSSWLDRALFGGSLTVFGLGFFLRNRRNPRMRVRPPLPPGLEKIPVEGKTISGYLEAHAARLGRRRAPLRLSEATEALERGLGDPQCRILAGQAELFFREAQKKGFVHVGDGMVVPAGWVSGSMEAKKAFFLRRFSDACIQSGFAMARSRTGFRLVRGRRKLDVAVDAERKIVRIPASKKAMTLEAFRAHLAF